MLEEEIRRVPVYLRWRADWWESRKAQRPELQDDARQREGHDAYATRQARILRRIAERFDTKCASVPALLAASRAELDLMEAEAAKLAAEEAKREAEDEAEDESAAGAADDEEETDDDDDDGSDLSSKP